MMKALDADLVVAGGGTAGCAAAVAAARRGHAVMLVEELNALGGTSSTGGVSEWFASLEGLGDIFESVKGELQRFGGRFGRFYNPEHLKMVWQRLAEESGVVVLLGGSVTGVEVSGRRITGLRVTAASRGLVVHAPYAIDATGEGDLGYLAGAGHMQGDPEGGTTLHMSLTFTLIDSGREVDPYLPGDLEPINSEDELPGLRTSKELPDGRVYCNMTKVMGRDPTDPLERSRAELEARRQMVRVLHFLQSTRFPRHVPVASGSRIGIREGRRLVGDYILTGEEILSGRTAHLRGEGVAVATAQIDFHSLSRPGNRGWRERVDPYPIPYRSLVVRDLDNLLAAGKCISGDQVAMSSYRMTPTCTAMGQAAGTAIALLLEGGREGRGVRDLDVGRLRSELAGSGMVLDPDRHEAFAPQETPDPRDAR